MIEEGGLILFTDSQIAALKRDLKIGHNGCVEELVIKISAAHKYYQFVIDMRKSAPDIKTARDRVSAILHHASCLKAALQEENLPGFYFEPDRFSSLGPSIALQQYTVERSQEADFRIALDRLISTAQLLVSDEAQMRAINLLPSRSHSNQSAISQTLWPQLFKIYAASTGGFSFSPGGPLERFMRTVHEGADLPEPSSATLRFVAARWKRDRHDKAQPKKARAISRAKLT